MGRCAFRFLRLVLFVLALIGLGLSGYLTYLHMLDMQGGAMPRLCGGPFDCSTVLQSPYATIGGVVPIAILGVVYFTLLAIWIMFVGRLPGKLHHACLLPALVVTAGAIDSAYLIYIMGWRLHAWCSFCLATHVVNFLMFGGVWAAWLAGCRQRDQEELAALGQKQLWKVPVLTLVTGCCLALSVVFLAGMGAFAVKYKMTAGDLAKIQEDPDYQRWQYMRTPFRAEALSVAADDTVRGPAEARHTLVMFADFQCQYCGMTDRTLRKVMEELDSLRIVFKHYPQSEACNAAMAAGSNKHMFACQAAWAAEAAYKLGGNEAFWKMHDALYDNQERLAEKPYVELARQIGLDAAAFAAAMQAPEVQQRIEQHAALGKALDIPGTPVLFLDGRRVTLDIIVDPITQQPDEKATIRYWRNLLAAAEAAAATQPVAGLEAMEAHARR